MTVRIDCLGRPCPVPVIELAKAMTTVSIGEMVEVLSDDPASRIDIPAWCRLREQDYLGAQEQPRGCVYTVRRSS